MRDFLIAQPPHDWDFVVQQGGLDAARTVANALGGSYYSLDAERGTGRAIVPLPEAISPSEIVSPTGHVSPKKIILDFAELRGDTLIADLHVRDFTINAMAMTLNGKLIDPLNGYQDLKAGYLRLSYPEAFQADPARLLRAVRQATQFGLAISSETREHAKAAAAMLESVAAERLRDELVKILDLPAVPKALRALSDLNLLRSVLPTISRLPDTAWDLTLAHLTAMANVQHMLNGDIPTTRPRWLWDDFITITSDIQAPLLDYLRQQPESEITRGNLLRWGALFATIADAPQVTETRLTALRFSRNAIAYITQLLSEGRALDRLPMMLTRRHIYQYYQATGETGPGNVLLALAKVLAAGDVSRNAWREQLKRARTLWVHYFHHPEIVAPVPFLTGRDMMALGVPQGPAVGEVLRSLMEAQAAGEVGTVEEARDHVRRWMRAQ